MKTKEKTHAKEVADKRYENVGIFMHKYMDRVLSLANKHFLVDGEEQDILALMIEYECDCVDVAALNSLPVGDDFVLVKKAQYSKVKRIG